MWIKYELQSILQEQQTALHIASRLGNSDIVVLLLQHGAAVDATTKDHYTALHIAAKEGQEEVASVLLEHGASLTSTTKKGFTPLHLAAKYGNMKVARLLLQKDAPVDAQGKNGVTPLHVAAHYDHQVRVVSSQLKFSSCTVLGVNDDCVLFSCWTVYYFYLMKGPYRTLLWEDSLFTASANGVGGGRVFNAFCLSYLYVSFLFE